MRMTRAWVVGAPMPGMLSTRSNRRARSACTHNAAVRRFQFGGTAGFQTRDVGGDNPQPPLVCDVLDPGLETGDVVLDLLDERQVIAQFVEARIGRHGVAGIECHRAGSDEDGIQPIVLGAAEVQLGERLDLERLQHDDDEAVGLQDAG